MSGTTDQFAKVAVGAAWSALWLPDNRNGWCGANPVASVPEYRPTASIERWRLSNRIVSTGRSGSVRSDGSFFGNQPDPHVERKI
jgi:hypothetical protein